MVLVNHKYELCSSWEEYELQTRNEIVFGVSERQIGKIKESILNGIGIGLEENELSSDSRDYELFMAPGDTPNRIIFHLEPSTICGRITLRKDLEAKGFEGDVKYLRAMLRQSEVNGSVETAGL